MQVWVNISSSLGFSFFSFSFSTSSSFLSYISWLISKESLNPYSSECMFQIFSIILVYF